MDSRQAHYRRLVASVDDALRRHDPIGQIGMGAPKDEYEAERGTILPRLRAAEGPGDVATIVHEYFVRWLGAETAGTRANYEPLPEAIWDAWLVFRRGAA